jgi:hypothetical protein
MHVESGHSLYPGNLPGIYLRKASRIYAALPPPDSAAATSGPIISLLVMVPTIL